MQSPMETRSSLIFLSMSGTLRVKRLLNRMSSTQPRIRSKSMSARIGFCINPMSGRDVRRLAGRASNMTHEAKRDMVARLAAGADALGVDEIIIVREPFSIAEKALQHMKPVSYTHLTLPTKRIV